MDSGHESGHESKRQPSTLAPHPQATANMLSKITFLWTLGLFRIGHSREFVEIDLSEPLTEHESARLGDRAEEEWNKELTKAHKKKGKFPNLWLVLIRMFGWKWILMSAGLQVVEISVKLWQPILLGRLLNYFSPDSNMSFDEAKLYGTGVAVLAVVYSAIIHPFILALIHLGLKVRVALSSLMYRKLLRTTSSANLGVTGGYLINILTNDMSRFEFGPLFFSDLVIGLFLTAIVSYMMWIEVGLTGLSGMAVLGLFIPCQAFLAKKSTSLRQSSAARTDKRVQLMNEIITGIQAIKMYGWEKPFADVVDVVRRKEVNVIKIKSYITGVLFGCSMFLTKIALFISLLFVSLDRDKITAQSVFVLTLYYNILQENLTSYFPIAVQKLSECYVSVRRIREFLLVEESKSAVPKQCSSDNAEIILHDVSASWSEEQDNVLKNLNIHVTSGSLVAVVGQVGSGKTSLLQLILNEMPRTVGTVEIQGSISYSSQEAWLFPATVCENILFGLPMDIQRYEEVVRVCALVQDFKQFTYGDKTFIGERGVCLSGGQRARVNLARAVYRRADIYILDDPLSAVDSHVGRHLFEDCICNFLSGKIVLLATHQFQFLVNVKHVIVMEEGRIAVQGPFSELQSIGHDLFFSKNHVAEDDGHGEVKSVRKLSLQNIATFGSIDEEEEAEMTSSGKVEWKVYFSYFRSAWNIPSFLCVSALFILSQLLASGTDYWTSYWVDLEEYVLPSNQTETLPVLGLMDREKCVLVYGVLIILLVIVVLLKAVMFFSYCMKASKRLHDKMFRTVSTAKMHFFNNNPSGRILNRFSKDMGVIDESLPQTMEDTLKSLFKVLGVLMLITVVDYWLIIPCIFIGALFLFLRQYYVATARSLLRLDGSTRSPMFTLVNSTLQGLPTIRSMHALVILITVKPMYVRFGGGRKDSIINRFPMYQGLMKAQDPTYNDLQRQFDRHQNMNTTAYYFTCGVNRAFGFWLDLISALYMVFIIFSCLYLVKDITGGEVGLAITQSLALTFMCQWTMRRSAELENYMTSVERVLAFGKVDSEEALLITPCERNLSKDWPTKGDITFRDVHLRYDPDDPPVLKNLNFSIYSGEKIGIVGRTGAGKSSIVNALFHLQPVEGFILIDEVDTSTIGLQDLRSRMSIIPQEPVLFTGTLRRNLDPFEEYCDRDIWTVLEEVELKAVVEEMPGQLFSAITEGGSNLSVGQRQLVCLARAILRHNKILVLDEATANMDPQTDRLIQSALRKKFSHCTVLTIAHRLHSVMDSDRILVMDDGKVAEFGIPHELLQNSESYLSSLVHQTGTSDSVILKSVAEEAYKKKSQ